MVYSTCIVEGVYMNEIVKYNNHMNLLNFDNFNPVEFNMFFALCSVFKEQKDTVIVLGFNEIKQMIGYASTSTERFVEDLRRMNDKLQKVNSRIKLDKLTLSFILFPTYAIDEEGQTLSVRVNPDFAFLLNDLSNNFTLFELKEFIELKSKYSKTLYRLLKQWRTVGHFEVQDIEEFFRTMDVPSSYEVSLATARCVSPAVKELQSTKSFSSLKMKTVRKGKGGHTSGYLFDFTPDSCLAKSDSGMADSDSENVKYPVIKRTSNAKKKNTFCNFPQRVYDKDSLESFLLNNPPRRIPRS